MQFNTQAVHGGHIPEPNITPVATPIYLTTTYSQVTPGVYDHYDYTRAGNPNFTELENQVASLEHGKFATVFSSGMGAITTLASLLESNDTVLLSDDLYGGTYRLFNHVFAKFGVKTVIVDMQDLAAFEKSMEKKPKLVFLENPSNPFLKIYDIRAIAERKSDALLIADTTLATPYLQNPLLLGADIVLHSTSKYIGGHSDAIGGILVTNNEELGKRFDFLRKTLGVNPSPMDSWLIARGLKTLGLRLAEQEKNASTLANFLAEHKKVRKVYYPGLPSHTNHKVAAEQMRGYGGMLTVDFDLDLDRVRELVTSFSLFKLAESLGGVESLVNHPALMTHASIPKPERELRGITDSLVRFSVGIESKDDLLEDMSRVLNRA